MQLFTSEARSILRYRIRAHTRHNFLVDSRALLRIRYARRNDLRLVLNHDLNFGFFGKRAGNDWNESPISVDSTKRILHDSISSMLRLSYIIAAGKTAATLSQNNE